MFGLTRTVIVVLAIYCTQLIGGDFPIRANFATLLYQSIVGS